MAGISSIGGQSSVEQLVEQFLTIEARPLNDLQGEKSSLQKRLKIFSDLRSKLTTLNDRVKKINRDDDSPVLAALKAKSSKEQTVRAEISDGATTGVTNVKVHRLATRDMAVSSKIADLQGASLAEKFDGTTQTFQIQIGDGDFVSLSLDFDDPTETNEQVLQRLVDTFRGAGLDITSTLLRDTATSARVTITSNETGQALALTLEDVDTSGLLQELGILGKKNARREASGTTGGFITVDTATLDSLVNINGIEVIKGSNTITDVIDGVILELLAQQDADDGPVTISVEQDSENVRTEIKEFIDEYNVVIKYLNEQTRVNTTTFERGALAGNFIFTNLRLNLRSAIASAVSSAPAGSPFLLSELGLSTDRAGILSISDQDKFDEALAETPQALENIFTGEDGIAGQILNLLDRFISRGGVVDDSRKNVDNRIKNINSRIDRFEDRLRVRETQLRRQFTDLQRQLSRLQSQQSIISQTLGLFGRRGGAIGSFF